LRVFFFNWKFNFDLISVQIVSAVLGSIGLQNFASGEGIDVRVNSAFRILMNL